MISKYIRENAASANIAEFAAAAGPEPLKPLVIIWRRNHSVRTYPERLVGREHREIKRAAGSRQPVECN